MFCYQQNFFTPTKVVTPELFWALVGAPKTQELISGLRQRKEHATTIVAAAVEEEQPQAKALLREADDMKKKLPAFIFQATFDETTSKKGYRGTWRKQAAARLNGLCVLDVDHVEKPREVFARWKAPLSPPEGGTTGETSKGKTIEAPSGAVGGAFGSVLLIYVTPSGHGLKVVFKADPQKGNLIDNMNAMARVLGVEADQSCKDASRMSFICTKEDILYINENELFTYENKEFAEKYNEKYRGGDSRPTHAFAGLGNAADGAARRGSGELVLPAGVEDAGKGEIPVSDLADNSKAGSESAAGSLPSEVVTHASQRENAGGAVVAHASQRESTDSYHGVAYQTIVDCWLNGQRPQPGDRHRLSLSLASDLRYICDNDARKIERILRDVPFVKEIIDERGEDVSQTVKSAMAYTMYRNVPKKMAAALARAGADDDRGSGTASADGDADATAGKGIGYSLPLEEWGEKLNAMAECYPCMAELFRGMDMASRPAVLFASAAFLGTLMTRTWYHFYHRPEEERRLNYCVMIIGDPASGKSMATKLYKLLAAPIRVADQVGYEAMNRYNQELKERSTSTKAQKGDVLKKPEVIIRDHPSRTSNAQFIIDMNNAVEEVTYPTGKESDPMATKRMNLHLLTFDSELDNSISTQKGGSWIDKQSMELKAYHNEEDGQVYSNKDSHMGVFNVYWNYIYTGTPLSLKRKVNEANFGTGLATRLAVLPLPSTDFRMMELKQLTADDIKADATLKEWAFRLDKVAGELPLWPIVEETWHWASEQMVMAKVNDSKAQEMLLKRVPYYGITITAPFILMRYWQQWKEKATFTIDQTDLDFCRLVLNIQYQCQLYFFSNYAEKYFENMRADNIVKHTDRFRNSFLRLKDTFDNEDLKRAFGVDNGNAYVIASRLVKEGLIKRTGRGTYTKLKNKQP